MHRSLFVAVVFTAVGCASGGASASQAEPASAAPAAQQSPAATDPDLTAADLRTRLFAYAHDSMFGRASGTEGNFRATEYLAAEMERLGLEPAGDANGYFQQVPAFSRRLASSTAISIEGQNFELGTDFVPLAPIQGLPVNAQGSFTGVPVVYAGRMGTLEMLPPDEAVGKLVVVGPALDPDGNPTFGIDGPSLIGYARAAGIALANLEYGPSGLVGFLLSPQTFIADGPPPPSSGPPVMFVSTSMVSTIFGKPINELETGDAGTVITGGFEFETARTEWPVRNVIAILRGSDPDRSGEYVALGAHSDHVGIARQVVSHDSLRSYLTVVRPNGAEDEAREPTESEAARIATMLDSLRSIRPSDRPDSISNGADDDGSGTVTLLEIAEAFASSDRRPARSLLFVWHNAEEDGLLGAEHFTDNPTVDRSDIVAQLNIDMIGRGDPADLPDGGPGYIQLIGSRRLSTELGDLVEQVNTDGGFGFEFDYQYDADGHPQQFYCRSDHYMYARYGIPIVFFSTGSHRDYHMVTDEPQYINYDKMGQIGRFIMSVAARVANLDHRVVVDGPVPEPGTPCRQ